MEDLKHNSASSEHVESYELSNSKNPNQDQDADLQAYATDFAQRDPEWHSYKTKHLLKKIDLHLLPWIVLMYLTNFLDRTALAQARLGTLVQDLGLKGT
ncbi:uncharacterized protein LY89DRAFT_735144 [Mollisia scopiformis]|uniref:Uncharacterized protein n=1 Tax=Mollisia scopiformis TaxID=149040 RepID=A0A194X748_MOLSC|nr:uncharacterized protein LY89DRAFT_735144 [Mollisia scopiformis]KUJ16000.1 hypothetical protein LY89DRAFT_735144 [Mollisia scopiformis]